MQTFHVIRVHKNIVRLNPCFSTKEKTLKKLSEFDFDFRKYAKKQKTQSKWTTSTTTRSIPSSHPYHPYSKSALAVTAIFSFFWP